jgi:hypothetical protein
MRQNELSEHRCSQRECRCRMPRNQRIRLNAETEERHQGIRQVIHGGVSAPSAVQDMGGDGGNKDQIGNEGEADEPELGSA